MPTLRPRFKNQEEAKRKDIANTSIVMYSNDGLKSANATMSMKSLRIPIASHLMTCNFVEEINHAGNTQRHPRAYTWSYATRSCPTI